MGAVNAMFLTLYNYHTLRLAGQSDEDIKAAAEKRGFDGIQVIDDGMANLDFDCYMNAVGYRLRLLPVGNGYDAMNNLFHTMAGATK